MMLQHVSRTATGLLLSWLTASVLAAGEPVMEVKLWPQNAPGEVLVMGPETATASGDPPVTRVSNVSVPTLTLFRPPAGQANGRAVLVCPGGGYSILAFDLEGTEIAQWLNSIGITAAVLKYRVPGRGKEQLKTAPLQDAQRGLRLMRQSAQEWGLDAARIGVLGFSAGGHLAVMVGTHWDEQTYQPVDAADALSCRPDFVIPIYPAYLEDPKDASRLSPLVRINARTPPTFVAITYDDHDRPIYAALLLVELKKAGVPAELHVYARGGHGYGLRPSSNPVSQWPKRCEEWLVTLEAK